MVTVEMSKNCKDKLLRRSPMVRETVGLRFAAGEARARESSNRWRRDMEFEDEGVR